jgi:aspartate aminotransferase-like enzyme
MLAPSLLLDLPAYPADGYGGLADRLKALLNTRSDLVFVQGEAILALEAAATSLARPGMVALNIVTSPYGGYFGGWLQRAGATVRTVAAEIGRPITAVAVEQALELLPRVDLLAVVHAETSSGILNPLPEIASMVRARDALFVVDAVASIGGHPLDVDGLGIDVCVAGPQKALAGPAGLSFATVSARAWAAMPIQTGVSSLSLPGLKTNWLERGRGALPGMPSALEFWALEAALDRVEAETLPARIVRHQTAARATREGLRALGAKLWVEDDGDASALATAVRVPSGEAERVAMAARELGASASVGFGAVNDELVRLDHTGQRANPAAVLANLVGYALATGVPIDTVAIRRIVETIG